MPKKGYKQTPEAKAAGAAARKKLWEDPAYRAKIITCIECYEERRTQYNDAVLGTDRCSCGHLPTMHSNLGCFTYCCEQDSNGDSRYCRCLAYDTSSVGFQPTIDRAWVEPF